MPEARAIVIPIRYHTQYGTVPSATVGKSGYPLEEKHLPVLTYEGYKFIGWYYDEAFTQEAKVGDIVGSYSFYLYAKWVEVPTVKSKMTAIADEIRELSGTTELMGLDAMASTLNAENTNFASNLTTQDNLISQIQTALQNKTSTAGGSVETCTLYTGATNNQSTAIVFSVYEDGQVVPYVTDTPNTTNTLISNSIIKNSHIVVLDVAGGFDVVGLESINSPSYHAKIYKITGDATFSFNPCFAYGTLILLSDGTTKQVQDITYEDSLLVWDFDNACYSSAKPLWIKKAQTSNYYYECEFDNGITLKLVGSNGKCHRLFNVDDNCFESATDCVGKNIMTVTGVSKLIKCERVDETVEFYNIITNYHLNLFANSVLTSCRLNNLYPIENMKFIKENRQNIPKEKYGNIDDKFYYGLRLDERNCNDIDELNVYVERLYMLMEKEV